MTDTNTNPAVAADKAKVARAETVKQLKADMRSAHDGLMTLGAVDRVLSATLDGIVTSEKVREGRIAMLAHATISGVIAAEAPGANMPFGGTYRIKGTKGTKAKPGKPATVQNVVIDRAALHKVARDTGDDDLVKSLKAALVSHSAEAQSAQTLVDALPKMSEAERFARQGEVERAKKVAQAASQAILRPLRLAAIVLTDPDFVAESARLDKNGVLEVTTTAKPDVYVKLGNASVNKAIARLTANARAVSNAAAGKPADTREGHDNDSPLAQSIKEAVRTGQKGVALDIIRAASSFATMVAGAPDKPENKPTGELREEMLALWAALEACFPDTERAAYHAEMADRAADEVTEKSA